MKSANEAELVKLEGSIKDAEENLGDIEVRDAYLAKADYLYKIGASPEMRATRHLVESFEANHLLLTVGLFIFPCYVFLA